MANTRKKIEDRTKASNPTTEKLQGLPFNNASELKNAQKKVLLEAWTRLENSRAINELVCRPEYKFWREEFETGISCVYGDNDDELVRVFSVRPGIRVTVSKKLDDDTLAVLVKTMSECFTTAYYKARGILCAEKPTQDDGEGKKAPVNL